MKAAFVSTLILSLSATAAMAGDGVSDAEKNQVLSKFLDGIASYKIGENRSYFFASGNNTVQVGIQDGSVSIAAGNGKTDARVDGAGIGLYRDGADRQLKIEELSNNQIRITSTEYMESNYEVAPGTPPHSVSNINEVTVSKNGQELTVTGVSTSYFDCKDAPGVSGCVFTLKPSPAVVKNTATARFVMSLGDAETSAMGKQVMKVLGETRDGGAGSCSILSNKKMSCSWALATDYADDTASAEFSIKRGKIERLLSTNFEPGC